MPTTAFLLGIYRMKRGDWRARIPKDVTMVLRSSDGCEGVNLLSKSLNQSNLMSPLMSDPNVNGYGMKHRNDKL